MKVSQKHLTKPWTWVVTIYTGFYTGFDYIVAEEQVESLEELIDLIERWGHTATKDRCELNFKLHDCGFDDTTEEEVTFLEKNSYEYPVSNTYYEEIKN